MANGTPDEKTFLTEVLPARSETQERYFVSSKVASVSNMQGFYSFKTIDDEEVMSFETWIILNGTPEEKAWEIQNCDFLVILLDRYFNECNVDTVHIVNSSN
jgi:hypothetical protein